MNIKAIGKALTNKVGGVMAAPKVKYHESKARTHNRNADFMQDYNAKKKSGVPVSNKEQAQFQGLKDSYSK